MKQKLKHLVKNLKIFAEFREYEYKKYIVSDILMFYTTQHFHNGFYGDFVCKEKLYKAKPFVEFMTSN